MLSELIKREQPPKFPALYRNIEMGHVVVATTYESGIVVVGGGSTKVGEYGTNWISFDREDVWERVPMGTQVILTQE